jgi:hypothetical protein
VYRGAGTGAIGIAEPEQQRLDQPIGINIGQRQRECFLESELLDFGICFGLGFRRDAQRIGISQSERFVISQCIELTIFGDMRIEK